MKEHHTENQVKEFATNMHTVNLPLRQGTINYLTKIQILSLPNTE
jgi:hypothetical protein